MSPVRLRQQWVRVLVRVRPLPERLGRAAGRILERRLVSAYDALVEAEARRRRP